MFSMSVVPRSVDERNITACPRSNSRSTRIDALSPYYVDVFRTSPHILPITHPSRMYTRLRTSSTEMRVDAWKMTQQCRRPEPRSCEDIGTWYIILEVRNM
jgi:hypothetical protein